MRHHSGYFSDDAETPALRVGAATMVDAQLSYRLGAVTLLGFARNLLDAFNLTYVFNRNLATAARPREMGVGIDVKF
jgi:hypothetical protein